MYDGVYNNLNIIVKRYVNKLRVFLDHLFKIIIGKLSDMT